MGYEKKTGGVALLRSMLKCFGGAENECWLRLQVYSEGARGSAFLFQGTRPRSILIQKRKKRTAARVEREPLTGSGANL